jgi:hypothetical protein
MATTTATGNVGGVPPGITGTSAFTIPMATTTATGDVIHPLEANVQIVLRTGPLLFLHKVT